MEGRNSGLKEEMKEGRKEGKFLAMSLCCAELCEALSTTAMTNFFKAFSLFGRKMMAYDGLALHCIATLPDN